MLEEKGFEMSHYDPLFFPDTTWLEHQYDLITCSEVLEHIHAPVMAIEQCRTLLRPNGLLAIMTGFPPSADRFANWHYQRDPTHISFYGETCFHWIAERFGFDLEIPDKNVALLHKR